MGAVIEHGTPMVDDPDRLGAPSALGLDETSFLRAGPTHRRQMITGFVDLDRHLLLDVVEGRSGQVVRDWLDQRHPAWLEQVEVAVVDPFRGYATGLADRLPDATIVVDHFHAIRLANAAIDDVRRRVQQAALGHRAASTRLGRLGGSAAGLIDGRRARARLRSPFGSAAGSVDTLTWPQPCQ